MNLFELANDITLTELRQQFKNNGFNALKIRSNAVYLNKTIGIILYEIYITQTYATIKNTRKNKVKKLNFETYKEVYNLVIQTIKEMEDL